MSGLLDQFRSSRMATSSPSSGRVALPPDQEITQQFPVSHFVRKNRGSRKRSSQTLVQYFF